MKVYILYHIREIDDEEEVKQIGVYSSRERAEEALQRVKPKPGFRDHVEGFHISEVTVDRDSWVEGFISVEEAMQEPPSADEQKKRSPER
jgi:hypothetical protein